MCFRECLINKCAAPKCTSGYASNEKRQISKCHFPLKNAELKKQWIRFVNRRDWIVTKHLLLCELHFEEKYLPWGEKCSLQWSMNLYPLFIPKTFWVIYLRYQHSKLLAALPEKRSFPDELSTFKTWHNKNLSRFKRINCTCRLLV